MLYTITPQAMRDGERQAFERGVSPLLLMETAAQRILEALSHLIGPLQGKTVLFLCGAGNNGGDGLAAARLLLMQGGHPLLCMPEAPKTPEAETNLRYVRALGLPFLSPDAPLPPCDGMVDALFGTGFRGSIAADSPLGRLIQRVQHHAPCLSVDVPSGMDADTGAVEGVCVQADITLCLHRPKHGLYLSPHRRAAGEIRVADIGLNRVHGIAWTDGIPVAEPADLPRLLPPRPIDAHKGACGRALLFAGSRGMAGAAVMAAQACLRAGAGLVTVLCGEEVLPVLQCAVPNAMAVTDPDALPAADACLFGCGLAETRETYALLRRLHSEKQWEVWDAGALNLLAGSPFPLGAHAIITPHVGEAARLLHSSIQAVLADLVSAAHALQKKFACHVLLKSATSVILDANGQAALNVCGSPALAKGGSGDMLAGMVTALLAQGMPPFTAMQCAALWHGMAARHAVSRYGVRSPLTGDIIEALGLVAPHE